VQAVARGVASFGKTFDRLNPDVVVVLGDRIEVFAAASAAAIGGVRIAHLHGGDRAEGVTDESMRHAVSKLAHLHFAATAQSRRRLVRMGEHADQVWQVGSPAIDTLSAVEVSEDPPQFVVIQHPIGCSLAEERQWMQQTLAAVTRVTPSVGDFDPWILISPPNADPGSDGIEKAIAEAVRNAARLSGGRYRLVAEHVPRAAFLAHLAEARAIVGNSSAGLIEAAALRVPCVNIGPRQAGREKPRNVVDCGYGQRDVSAAISKALRLQRSRLRHPYGDGHAGERIAEILAKIDLAAIAVRKQNAY